MSTPQEDRDRREEPRVPAGRARAIIVEIEEDGIMVPGTLVPHDLSVGGVRGKWERALPEGLFALRLEIASDVVETIARVAWQRPLPGRAVLAGLSFVSLTPASRLRIMRYLEALQTPSRRRSPRYSDVLPVEVVCEGESLTAIVSNISVDGLQITTDAELPECEDVTLLVPLTWDVPIEVSASFRWRRTTPHDGQVAGLELRDVSDDVRMKIDDYLRDLTA